MSYGPIKTFKDLLVWRKAFALSIEVYRCSNDLPRHETYGLKSELRKTARSTVYNIAEGHKRGSTIEYIHFLRIAAGSAAELETQILLADKLGYLGRETAQHLADLLAEVKRMLDALIRSLQSRLGTKA